MDLRLLRAATRAEHESVESHMPLMEPGLTLATYLGVLRRLYPLVAGWEAFATMHAPSAHRALIAGRRRAALLERDLRALDPLTALPAPAFDSARIPALATGETSASAPFLGAMYVLEGSTLGGQHIARHVEPLLGLSPEHGTAYFRGYGPQTAEMWRDFQECLLALPAGDAPVVIAAARAMFAVFEHALA